MKFIYLCSSCTRVSEREIETLFNLKVNKCSFYIFIKRPLLWVMKDSYFGFGSPQQQVNSMQGQKTRSYSYNIFSLFSQRLPNDSLND